MKSTLKAATEARQAAEHQLITLRAQAEAKTYEHALRLLESPVPVKVPWSEYPAFDQFGMWPGGLDRPYYWSSAEDRTEGRYRPIYETEQDLRIIRAQGRRFQSLFPIAAGALESLTNYVIGTGFDYKVQAEVPGAEEMASKVQAVVDAILEDNDFVGNLDREIFRQSYADGECFPTLYVIDNHVAIELTQPDYIKQPLNPQELERWQRTNFKLNYWWHGVHTVHSQVLKREDTIRPLGYHAVFDREGDQWDYLPVSRVEHFKRNVGLDGRRGIGEFYIVANDLEQEAKVRKNTAVTTAILSAIAMIRQHAEGVTKSSIENMVSANATSTYEKRIQDGTRTTISEQVAPGTIKDTPYGMTYTLGAIGTMKAPVYIQVMQDLRRVIGHALGNMPEYLISSDASNANYASTLVAESPFVKYCEHQQQLYARKYECLLWKAIRIHHEAGKFGGIGLKQLRAAVSIKVDYSSPAGRDQLQQAQTNKILVDMGVMSLNTAASDVGLDYKEEQQDGAKVAPVAPPAPFGQPHANGIAMPRLESLAERALARLAE